MPMAGYCHDNLDDEASFLSRVVRTRAPTAAIGLQCSELSFDGRAVKAGRPWWRGGLA
ncbi:unnamed protein product [Phaeothamnion confervicola]